MDLVDRIIMLFIGGCVGYVLARMVDYLRAIKEEVDVIDELVHEHDEYHRGERGITRLRPIVMDIILLGVVAMVAYAAFASQKASNAVETTQLNQTKSVQCTSEFLEKTIVALNQRTVFTARQTENNVAVQQAQADFFLGVYADPANDKLELKLFQDYVKALETFVNESKEFTNRQENPYPTSSDFNNCLNE